jgi:phosphatidylglycerophosphatase A
VSAPDGAADPSRATAAERLAVLVATAGGVGYAPVAPGTVASAVTVVAVWLLKPSVAGLMAASVIVIVGGTLAAQGAERALGGGKDPGAIVIDEVAGMLLTVLFAPATPVALAVGFVLFRIFDVVKVFPADRAERLPGGIGVMLDDVISGLYGLGVLAVLRTLFAWP